MIQADLSESIMVIRAKRKKKKKSTLFPRQPAVPEKFQYCSCNLRCTVKLLSAQLYNLKLNLYWSEA